MKAVSLLILLVTSLGFSQDIFIYNVDVFDGERLIDDSTILVEDGKISAVGVENPSNFSGERIDGQGGFIMPGMTNCHVHAFAPTSLEEAAEAGVLNVMDMHGVELYQKMIAAGNEASTKARYFYAGYAATAPEGHGTQYGFPVPTLTSEADAPKFVSDRLADPNLNLPSVIDDMDIGRSVFYEKVKALTNMTPNQYIQELRLVKAKTILEEGNVKTVKEVTYSVGMNHPNYFSKLFKERFGISPSTYFRDQKN